MLVQKVSFGNIIAIYGRDKKVNKIKRKFLEMATSNEFKIRNVTNEYVKGGSSGVLAQAAQRGDTIEIFVTGKEDLEKTKDIASKDLLSHASKPPFDANKLSIGDILSNIFNS